MNIKISHADHVIELVKLIYMYKGYMIGSFHLFVCLFSR